LGSADSAYQPGGADVSVADGGTGASNAAGARTNLGLGNVDNTSDAAKPVSTATQTALDTKLDSSAAPELIRDTMGTALVAGTNVTITPDDGGDTITIAASLGGGAGSGDVVGPSSSVDSQLAVYSGTTGKIIKALTYADLPTQGTTAPATPAAGIIRLYARTAPSGLAALAYMNSLGVPFVIARDRLFYAQNNTGSTLTKGTVVYVSSASGGVARITKAQADATMTAVPAAGVVAADITNGTVGAVMQGGVLEGMNTSAFSDGATLYVSPTTAGAITATKPAHPQVIQPLGECIQAHSSNGIILLNIAEINPAQLEGVNGATWNIGDATGTAKSIKFKNASGTGTLEWTPTTNRTWTVPDATDQAVGRNTTDTLTNKTLVAHTVTNYTESVVAIGNTGTAQTIALTNGTVQTATLTGNCTFTMPTATAGKSFVLLLKTGAGGFTAAFTGVKWPSAGAPTITATAAKMDIITFVADGSAWFGSYVQGYTP
jgi:hypothetical protein